MDLTKLFGTEANLEALLDGIEDGVYICSPDLTIKYANASFRQVVGDNLLGKKCYRAILNLEQPCPECLYAKQHQKAVDTIRTVTLPNEDHTRSVKSIILDNGDKLAIYSNNAPLENLRKQADEELIRSETKFRTIFENAPIMIDSFDANGKCLLWNRQCQKRLGYTQEELNESKDPLALFYPDPTIRQEVLKSVYNADGRFREFEVVSKSGEIRIQTWANFRLPGDFTISVGRDVTEQRKNEKIQQFVATVSHFSAEENSLASFVKRIHHELKHLMPADNFYLALYDSDSQRYHFPYHADQFDHFETQEYFQLENSLTDYVRKTNSAELVNKEREMEIFGQSKHSVKGQYSPVWMGAPLIRANTGKSFGVIALQDYNNPDTYTQEDLLTLEFIAFNISVFIERVQNNQDLQLAKERAEESDRLKSAFLANMSHEIRTPMNGILGFAELLQEPDLKGDQQRKYLKIIETSGFRMLNIINDLIDISKIEAGQIDLNLDKIDLNHLFKELFHFFHPKTKAKGLKLINTGNSEDQTFLCSDKTRLHQVLVNLINNALKYTAEGYIKFGFNKKEDGIQFYVQDSGQGISNDLKPKLFERFSRDSLAPVQKQEGSGLGLGISKGLIELLQGKVWFESSLGKGSTFYFTLPITIIDPFNPISF